MGGCPYPNLLLTAVILEPQSRKKGESAVLMLMAGETPLKIRKRWSGNLGKLEMHRECGDERKLISRLLIRTRQCSIGGWKGVGMRETIAAVRVMPNGPEKMDEQTQCKNSKRPTL